MEEILFINELDNEISMSVIRNQNEVTVTASGPTSLVEHTWTLMEATALRNMLTIVIDGPPTI